MGGIWGSRIKIAVFGESHGAAIGVTLSGLPPGITLDIEGIEREMARRAPGRSPLSTPRAESDKFEIVSGFFEGKTTGTPLCAIIRNGDARSADYQRHVFRPGHADLPVYYKYNGFADHRGGGHSSGRLTAPLVFAGAIAKQILARRGIRIGARISGIAGIDDANATPEQVIEVSGDAFPVIDKTAAARMTEAVLEAKERGDSVGGVIECAALGVPAGWGDPFFDSLESVISGMMFSIPAVKGVEFGDGFKLAGMTGSASNDQMRVEDGAVRFLSNRSGGINGGISNGQPLVFRVAVRATPTVGAEQTTVDISKMETVAAAFGGRHDPCIVPRAVPAAEAGLALCLLDFYLGEYVK